MPKSGSGGRKAFNYSRLSLTSPGSDPRHKIQRPSPTADVDQHQMEPLSYAPQQTSSSPSSQRRSPHGSNAPTPSSSSSPSPSLPRAAAQGSVHSNSASPASTHHAATNCSPSSQPPPIHDFRSGGHTAAHMTRQTPLRVSVTSRGSVHTVAEGRRSHSGSMTQTDISASHPCHLNLKTASAQGRDLRPLQYAEVSLRPGYLLSPEPPRDKGGRVYTAFVLCGVGYMLPFTCFVAAVDFYQARFPGSTIIFDLTLSTILAGTLGVLLNNILVEALPLTSRVTSGFVTSTTLLFLLTVADIGLNLFTPSDSYWITVCCVAAVAVGCAVQQSSFYGYANMLPRRYTQAVMLGESFAGTLVSANRIATKLFMEDDRTNTIIFFIISIVLVYFCWASFICTRKSSFVEFYLLNCARSRGRYGDIYVDEDADYDGVYEFDVFDYDPEPQLNYGAHNGTPIGPDLPRSQRSESMNPYQVRPDNLDPQQMDDTTSLVDDGSTEPSVLIDRLKARGQVIKLIYPYMVSFALTFYVTVCLYPGIVSEMTSCRLGSWMPVILMACFNVCDAFGKILTPVKRMLSRRRLLVSALFRFSLIPLALLCCMPREEPALSGEVWPILLTMVLGFTNGYYGSVSMVMAPSRVAPKLRELCGNTMMLAFTFAIVCGVFTSYGLNLLIGPHPSPEACLNSSLTS